MTSIGNMAFFHCTSLKSIQIPDSVTSIGESAFSGCSSLTSIQISDGVTSIGNGVFSSCSLLMSLVIPENVESIGDRAFSDCSLLESIIIPRSITIIKRSAFWGCKKLSVYYKGSDREWEQIADNNNVSYPVYFYSEGEPALNADGTDYNGNYWHYDTDGKTPVVWKKEN